MGKQLTKYQQQLVEENHNLIYQYAINNNLAIGEYYDLLAIGLCKAALIFNNEKGVFSTIAYKCMQNEVAMYWRHLSCSTSIPDDMIISIETPIESKQSRKNILADVISAGSTSVQDMVVGNIKIRELIELLTTTEKKVVCGIVNGLTPSEIAERLMVRRQTVSYHLIRVRQKWSSYLSNN